MVSRDLARLYRLLEPRERRGMWWASGLIVISAVLQLASLTTIYVFLSSITAPEGSLPSAFARLAEAVGSTGLRDQQVLLAAVAFVLLLASNASLVLVERAKFRLEARVNASLATRLFESYLARDYPFFAGTHSARLSRNVLTGVREVTGSLLRPVLDLLSKLTLTVAIVGLLLVLDPWTSLIVAGLLGVGFFAVHRGMRPWVRRQGALVESGQQERFRVAAEAFGGIKELKVLDREAYAVRRFAEPTQRMAGAQGAYEFSLQLQKYSLETVAFGAILLLVGSMLASGSELADIIPIVGLLAIAGYRLMPALRDIASAFTAFDFHGSVLDEVLRDFDPRLVATATPAAPWPLARSIQVDGVRFAYEAGRPVLDGVSLEIPAGLVVGFVGASGAGKSTLADLIMGLMPVQEGTIRVDGQVLAADRLRSWRRSIGYVPQEIFLADATIAQNIAFGVPADEVHLDAVKAAARLAQLGDLIEGQLPDGYATRVGERGVKLSGGQRQRIGIARALYHDPPVLVLDEATSDVDGRTEAAIASAVRSLGGHKTVILIAHRLTAIRSCDRLFFLRDGRLAASGRFDELMAGDPEFRTTVEGLLD